MLNPDFRKTQLKNTAGKVLLPQTTASMVSEEPDRRFVDNVEKSFLNAMTVYREAIENLSEVEEELLLLAENAQSIMPGTEEKEAISMVAENVSSLRTIVENTDILTGLSAGVIQMPGMSGKIYTLAIDDTDEENPKIVFVEVETD